MGEEAERRGRAAAQWSVVVLLSMIVGALGAELLFSPPASARTGSAGRSGVFAIAGQITGDSYGLYLVDVENGTICLYEYVAGKRRLWLRAARTFLADVRLDAYNTLPEPKEVLKMVSEARRLKDVSPKKRP